MGLALQYLGRYREADAYFQESMAIDQIRGNVEGQVINLANLGVSATLRGNYARAIALHSQAEEFALRVADEPWAAEQVDIARINRGVVLEKVGDFRKALDLYRRVLAGGRELDPRDAASLRVNVGVVYRNLGDPVRARDVFYDADSTFERLGDESALSNAFLNIGFAAPIPSLVAWGPTPKSRCAVDFATPHRLMLSLGRIARPNRPHSSCFEGMRWPGITSKLLPPG